uniref:Uncharacterized protein n=1 Tax=Arundo donax TaxID=35708 RepID=A0A0A9EGU3_ARUDO
MCTIMYYRTVKLFISRRNKGVPLFMPANKQYSTNLQHYQLKTLNTNKLIQFRKINKY